MYLIQIEPEYLSFYSWIISFSIIYSRFIHVVACVRISLFLRLNFFVYLPHFVYLFVNGHLSYFYLLAVVNNAAVNMLGVVLLSCTVDLGLPCWISGMESACNAEVTGGAGSMPGLGRSPGRGHGNSL